MKTIAYVSVGILLLGARSGWAGDEPSASVVTPGPDHPVTVAGQSDEATALKRQTQCPVMGGKIDRQIFVDHGGKRIYLCCRGCVGAVKADPEKYVRKLESEGVALDKVPDENPPRQEAGRNHDVKK